MALTLGALEYRLARAEEEEEEGALLTLRPVGGGRDDLADMTLASQVTD